MIQDFSGKRVLVTGGGVGIGLGIVRAFARQGAEVAFTYFTHEPDGELLDEPQLRRIGLEVVPRRRLRAEHAFAPFDAVEVDLEDARLAQQVLEHVGDDDLLALAQRRALA